MNRFLWESLGKKQGNCVLYYVGFCCGKLICCPVGRVLVEAVIAQLGLSVVRRAVSLVTLYCNEELQLVHSPLLECFFSYLPALVLNQGPAFVMLRFRVLGSFLRLYLTVVFSNWFSEAPAWSCHCEYDKLGVGSFLALDF